MKSRTSFFNPAVSKNLLKRFWPLWLAYFLVLLLVPLSMFNRLSSFRAGYDLTPGLNFFLANLIEPAVFLSLFIGILTAMAVFGFLYNTRSCGLMTSLPVTRTCLFNTCFLTGLLPLLAADVLIALVTSVFCRIGRLESSTLATAVGILMLSKLFFYGFACFCAMLTGNILVLPLIYLLLNFAVVLFEQSARDVLCQIVYGMSTGICKLEILSPPLYMFDMYNVMYEEWPERVKILGLSTFAAYAAVGLLFALAAWHLFLRRQMETAGDSVAIRILKPAFVGCMTLGSAFVLTDILWDILNVTLNGRSAAVAILLMMLLGAATGYFVACMIADKTLRVFGDHWKGCLVYSVVILLFIGVCEYDLFGFERWVPAADEVESVSFGEAKHCSDPETIQAALDLHKSLVDNKDWQETAYNMRGEYLVQNEDGYYTSRNLYLSYQLKNGKSVWRGYRVFGGSREMEDPDSDIRQMEDLYNLQEVVEQRCSTVYPMLPENVAQASLHIDRVDSNGEIQQNNVTLTPEELIDLWTNAVQLDVAEGHFGKVSLFEADRGWQKTDVGLVFMLVRDTETFFRQGGNSEQMEWHEYQITTEASHTLSWLREHKDLIPEPSGLNMFGVG